jgi:hypothetical protein
VLEHLAPSLGWILGSIIVDDAIKTELSTFKPLDPTQVFVIGYCHAVVSSFIGPFRYDLTAGLSSLQAQFHKDGSRIEFSPLSLAADIKDEGDGYQATLSFGMSGGPDGGRVIRLRFKARYDGAQCLAVFDFEDAPEVCTEVFNEDVAFSEGPDQAGDILLKKYGRLIFAEMNKRLRFSEGQRRLESIGLVISNA